MSFFAFIDQGYAAPWTSAAHSQNEIVTEAAAAAAGRLAAGGYTVVYDGVIGPWFVDVFGCAAGVTRLHYALLLPPEQLCLHRVESRVGHGFADLAAARHMYSEFASVETNSRHVVTSSDEPTAVARHIQQLVRDRSIVRPIQSQPCPG